jgi:hypothetical protein
MSGLRSKFPRFWWIFGNKVGYGYFAARELYVFGEGKAPMVRDSFMDRNSKDFWPSIFPAPKDGFSKNRNTRVTPKSLLVPR